MGSKRSFSGIYFRFLAITSQALEQQAGGLDHWKELEKAVLGVGPPASSHVLARLQIFGWSNGGELPVSHLLRQTARRLQTLDRTSFMYVTYTCRVSGLSPLENMLQTTLGQLDRFSANLHIGVKTPPPPPSHINVKQALLPVSAVHQACHSFEESRYA